MKGRSRCRDHDLWEVALDESCAWLEGTGHSAGDVRDALINGIHALPAQLRRSLIWDQGTQMANHKKADDLQ